ncbi:hypothetical protein CBR_g56716 [Chara braunii]|uniref:Uncharacterized protein n=1 Tax=Chara braunii TaxID=69332 RepID=A0A388MDV9_CHABU|nr:hypothetical protein CBR_g56716 [Chara braunii]|eukprot:GBG92685.1 hypothetical protein CBR_g56716 [Chara braunii]
MNRFFHGRVNSSHEILSFRSATSMPWVAASAEVLFPTPLLGLPQGQDLLFIVASGDHTVAVYQERRDESAKDFDKEEVMEEQVEDNGHTYMQEGELSGRTVQEEQTLQSRLISIPESISDGNQMEVDVDEGDGGHGSLLESGRRDEGTSTSSSPSSSSSASTSKWPASRPPGVMPSGLFTDSSIRPSRAPMQPSPRPSQGSHPEEGSVHGDKWSFGSDGEPSQRGVAKGKRPGNCVNSCSQDDLHGPYDGEHGVGLRPIKVPFGLLQLIQNAKASHRHMVVMTHAMEDLFSSVAFLPAEFKLHPSGHGVDAEVTGPGLDIALIKRVYSALWQLCEPELRDAASRVQTRRQCYISADFLALTFILSCVNADFTR